MKAGKPKNVDEYIAGQPDEVQPMLEQMRVIIRSVAPNAEEVVSYGVPVYKHHGMFIGFGVHKGGCSLYAMNTRILGEFSSELKGAKISGSTLHFDVKKKLPVTLVKKLVKARMKQNEERAMLKRAAKSQTLKSKSQKNKINFK